MDFSEIIGNNKTKESLKYKIINNELANSYMFVGIDGIGKKLIAKEFARHILCEDMKEKIECESCLKFKTNNHPDYIEIKPDGNSIKISQIRELGENIYKKPILSDRKIIIIDDAHLMTEEAQNALLKTLEEPPQYIVIILIVSNESMLLNTIKSRCVKINFYGLSNDEMLDYINKHKLLDKPSEAIIKVCDGSLGKLYEIKEKTQIYEQTEGFINYILDRSKEISLIEILSKSEFIYKAKADVNFILEYMMANLFIKAKEKNSSIIITDFIEIIKNTMEKTKSNANFDMCIDEMNFKIYERLSL